MNTDSGNLLSVFFEEQKEVGYAGRMPPSELTEKIIGCAYTVSNTLGCGFLEKVYENAFAHELRKAGFSVEQQKRVDVFYDGIIVGFYDADIVVNSQIITEVKAVRALEEAHKAQTLNYLKATCMRLGLLINFGSSRVEVKRVAL